MLQTLARAHGPLVDTPDSETEQLLVRLRSFFCIFGGNFRLFLAVETLANTCLSPLNTYILCSKTLHWNFATSPGWGLNGSATNRCFSVQSTHVDLDICPFRYSVVKLRYRNGDGSQRGRWQRCRTSRRSTRAHATAPRCSYELNLNSKRTLVIGDRRANVDILEANKTANKEEIKRWQQCFNS